MDQIILRCPESDTIQVAHGKINGSGVDPPSVRMEREPFGECPGASFDAYRVFGVHIQDTECYIVQTSSESGGMTFDMVGYYTT